MSLFIFNMHYQHGKQYKVLSKLETQKKLEACIDDERQFKTAKRSHGLLVAF